MVQAVLEQLPAARVDVAVVWIPMIPGDADVAPGHSVHLVPDPRVTHFRDAARAAGRAVAASLGAPDKVAWDCYLFYAPDARWGQRASAPRPATWFHQLSGEHRKWAGPDRYRWSEELAQALGVEAAARWTR